MKEMYRAAINEAIDDCTDLNLLDLVCKLLVRGVYKGCPSPATAEPNERNKT